MTDPIFVSVIMPAYNAAEFIDAAIASVQQQTYTNWELIIVNDGSTDNTFEVIEKSANNDQRIHIISQANSRQGAARNAAIRQSQGTYLAFIDADDIWLPGKLSLQIDNIQETGADFIFSDGWLLKGHSKHGIMGAWKGWIKSEEEIKDIFRQNRIPILTVLAKKEAILAVQQFNEDPNIQNAEDYHLWLKLLMNGYAGYGMSESLALYRLHEKNMTYHPENVFWPICYALADLQNTDNKYSADIASSLKDHLQSWLSTHRVFDRQKFENFCKLYFHSTNKEIPALLKFANKFLHFGNLPVKAFELLYA